MVAYASPSGLWNSSIPGPAINCTNVVAWFGLFAPAKTPEPVLDKLNDIFVSAASQPQVKNAVSKQGFLIETMSRAEFREFVKQQFDLMSRIIREANISL